MTVSQRLYLLIFSAAFGLMSLFGIGYYQLEKVYSSANYANLNTVPSLVLLDDLRKNYLRTRIQMNRHILNTDSTKMAEIEEILKKNRQNVWDDLSKYEKDGCLGVSCLSDDKDKEYINQIRVGWERFDNLLNPILAESRQNHTEKARDMMAETIDISEKR